MTTLATVALGRSDAGTKWRWGEVVWDTNKVPGSAVKEEEAAREEGGKRIKNRGLENK